MITLPADHDVCIFRVVTTTLACVPSASAAPSERKRILIRIASALPSSLDQFQLAKFSTVLISRENVPESSRKRCTETESSSTASAAAIEAAVRETTSDADKGTLTLICLQ